ncbi:hypothetical protein HOD75_03085 [archaeon]|jgi:hypothetical protein|nr:hypothetical protein [archaeon]MBT4241858.1 hypothetical protein [archaeon]MBT4418405.1 hypothetical protein [archaeon]
MKLLPPQILNCTPTEYCASVEQSLKDYKLRGVHAVRKNKGLLETFIQEIPKNTQVVVNYTEEIAYFNGCSIQHARGVAMIPRE